MDRAAAIRLLESTHTFPCEHVFRVIVRAAGDDADRVLASLAAFAGLSDLAGRVTRAPSRQGTYVSLRVTLPCATAERLLDVYEHLGGLKEVVRYL
jgi:putative lipoic acid-binding regulatory protein